MSKALDQNSSHPLVRPWRRLRAHRGLMRALRVAFGLVIGGSFVALLFHQVDLSAVRSLLANASMAPLLVAFVALVADFLLRAVRFWVMLEATAERRIPLAQCIAPYIASFGVNDVLPLRVGDGFRVVWFSSRFAIPAGTLIGTMLVERIFDLLSVIVLGEIAILVAGAAVPPALFSGSQLAAGVIIASGAVLLCVPALLSRLLALVIPVGPGRMLSVVVETLNGVTAAVRQVGSWSRLLSVAGLSLACWVFEGMIFIGAWLSLGGPMGGLAKAVLGFASGTLGSIIPSLPGHFGSYEYFGLEILRLVDVDITFAAAFMLLSHLILWLPTAVFGVVWLLKPSSRTLRVKAT